MRAVLAGLAAAALLLAALVGGGWVLGAFVAWSTASAVVLTGLWFGAVGLAAEVAGRRRARSLRPALRVTYALTTAALLAAGAYTSLHETTVDEQLDTGAPASRVLAPATADDLLAPQE